MRLTERTAKREKKYPCTIAWCDIPVGTWFIRPDEEHGLWLKSNEHRRLFVSNFNQGSMFYTSDGNWEGYIPVTDIEILYTRVKEEQK